MAVTAADPIKIIFAIILPPIGVFMEVGPTGQFPAERGRATVQAPGDGLQALAPGIQNTEFLAFSKTHAMITF